MTKLTVSLILFSALLRADCLDGFRKLNAAEQKLYDEVAAAFVAALPQPPESWKLSGLDFGLFRISY